MNLDDSRNEENLSQWSESPQSAIHVEPNQSRYQQAVRNGSVEQRSFLDCFANTVVENCVQLLFCVIVLKYCVKIPNQTLCSTVRRQGFWNQWLLKLRESLAHLVGFIMRRVVCVASVAFRMSFV